MDNPSTEVESTDQVVVESRVGPARTSAYEEMAVLALAEVEGLWGSGAVARPVRLVLPADGAAFAGLTGHAEDESEVPASTVGSGPRARVVIHPDAWDRLSPAGRQAVLTHEVTHLAMQGDGPVPGWFGEGLAEYTAHRRSTLSPQETAGSALDAVRQGSLPTGWPGAVPATGGTGGQWQGYATAWLACLYIAREYSEDDLVTLYRTVQDGRSWEQAVPAVLGVSDEELLTGWQHWLTDLVARS